MVVRGTTTPSTHKALAVSKTTRVLCVDVGGTTLKAAALRPGARSVARPIREPTPYPLGPGDLIDIVCDLGRRLGPYDRASVGFPGVVRGGRVVTAPFFATEQGPGSPVRADLEGAWSGCNLAGSLEAALGCAVLLANDADLHGAGTACGNGVELVVTLGTGVGTAIFLDGRPGPRLELAHHPLRDGRTYNEQLGSAALQSVGSVEWNRRVGDALGILQELLHPDRLLVGGGNARHLREQLSSTVELITEDAALLGGVRAWELGWDQLPFNTVPLGM